MKTHFVSLIVLITLTFMSHSIVLANVKGGGFVGLSGTSSMVFLVDTLTDSDGAIIEAAKEFGVLTGEIGLTLDTGFNDFGVRFETLAGYYKYRVLELPNTAYSMFMIGVGPYLKHDRYVFGCGYGRFVGSQWDEILGQETSAYRSHEGDSAWIMAGIEAEDIEINIRYRFHRFTKIDEPELAEYEGDDYEKLKYDVIFVLRIVFLFDILN